MAAVLVGAVVGGYVGARVARVLPAWALRAVVLVTAVTSTVVYIARG